MPFPELFEWLDIAIKDNQTEHQKAEAAQNKAEAAQKKAENEAKRRRR